MIDGIDFDQLFNNICRKVKHAPEYNPRGQKTKELVNANLVLYNPEAAILSNQTRKMSKKYIGAEILWYLEGNKSIENIKDYAKMWENIADPNGEVNSCYGWQIWNQDTPCGTNQWVYVINTLANDMYSRQAVININQPIHKYVTKDVPCTISIQYLIRDNKLDCIVTMRSCDIIFGLGNDVPFFTFVQLMLLEKMKKIYKDLELGTYYHNAGSLHIYERHYEMLDKILEDKNVYWSENWTKNVSKNIKQCETWKNG